MLLISKISLALGSTIILVGCQPNALTSSSIPLSVPAVSIYNNTKIDLSFTNNSDFSEKANSLKSAVQARQAFALQLSEILNLHLKGVFTEKTCSPEVFYNALLPEVNLAKNDLIGNNPISGELTDYSAVTVFKTADCNGKGEDALQILVGVSKSDGGIKRENIIWLRDVKDNSGKFLTWSSGDNLRLFTSLGMVSDSNDYSAMSKESSENLEQIASDAIAIMNSEFENTGQLGIKVTLAENTNL